MNLKLIVAPLFVLGLASTSALAAVQGTDATTTAAAPAPAQGSQAVQQYATMNNDASAKIDANWLNNIKLGGYLAIDGFGQSNQNALNVGQVDSQNSQSGITVGAAALNVSAQVNNWISADLNLFAAGSTQPNGISGGSGSSVGGPGTRYYPGDVNASKGGAISVDEAYVNVADFSQTPWALRAGQFYLPFGQYDRYAIMPTLTQQFTETRETALQVSYVANNGLHAAVYGFRGLPESSTTGSTHNNVNNGGVTIGYTGVFNNSLSFDAGLGFLYNVLDTGYFASIENSDTAPVSSYDNNASAWDGWVTAISGPFTVGLQYAESQAIDTTVATYNGGTAKPSVGTLTGSYAFNTAGDASKVTLSYGWSNQALLTSAGFGSSATSALPSTRVGAEYDVNIMANTMLGAEVNYDTAYTVANGGTGQHGMTGIVRLAVML